MPEENLGPAYRIETDRLIIRCFNPVDAKLLHASIQESKDHLLPWMPWANNEPEEMQKRIDRLRMYRANFDQNKEYSYGIFDKLETELIGGTGLLSRIGPDALEIGYWINVNHIGKGYATEATKALIIIAFAIEKVKRVEIHCDPGNIPSAAIPKNLGFVHEATLRERTTDYKGNTKDSMIWTMLQKEFLKSDIKNNRIEAFDAVGRKIGFS